MALQHAEGMGFSRQEKRGMASALVGAGVVVLGFVLLAGLTRAALVTAVVAALVSAAVVTGAIVFHAAYRRANEPQAAASPPVREEAAEYAFAESDTRRLDEPLRPAPREEEERPRP